MVSVSSLQSADLGLLAELRDLYRVDWPKYAFTFYTLENFVHWRKWVRDDDVLLFLDASQDWRVTGTFVIKDHNEIFFDSLIQPAESLKNVLPAAVERCGPSFNVVHNPRFREMMADTANSFSYDETSVERMICYRQSAPRGNEDQRELPCGYRVGPVRPEDSDFVGKQWEHNDALFANLPERLIERNASMGVYDMRGQLVAWCLIDQTGSLAIFQTLATHQRKGLGYAIIARFSRKLHEEGILPQAFVVESNVASRTLFEKLGFDVVDLWYWTKFDKLKIKL